PSGPGIDAMFALAMLALRSAPVTAMHARTTVLLSIACSTHLLAQANWQRRYPTVSPPGRYNVQMAFDEQHANALVFGGTDLIGDRNDTWLWDGSAWTQRVAPGPSTRSNYALAYDRSHARVVLFGGYVAGLYVGDTWTWDGAGWQQRTPAN